MTDRQAQYRESKAKARNAALEEAAKVVPQGWCVPPNTRKTFDPDLATAIRDLIRA